MWKFLLNLRLVVWILRFILYPVFVFSLVGFVFLIIGISLLMLIIFKTAQGIGEAPYLYIPLLAVELVMVLGMSILIMVYINKIRKKIKDKSGG